METLTAVIAYLHTLATEWDTLNDDEKRDAVRLALEAAKRGVERGT